MCHFICDLIMARLENCLKKKSKFVFDTFILIVILSVKYNEANVITIFLNNMLGNGE